MFTDYVIPIPQLSVKNHIYGNIWSSENQVHVKRQPRCLCERPKAVPEETKSSKKRPTKGTRKNVSHEINGVVLQYRLKCDIIVSDN